MTTLPELLTTRKSELGLSDAALGRRMVTPDRPQGFTDVAVETWRKGTSRPTQVSPETIAVAIEVPASVVRQAMGLPSAPPALPDQSAARFQRLVELAEEIPSQDLQSLVDFAEFLAARAEDRMWQDFALRRLGEDRSDDPNRGAGRSVA